MIKHPVPMNHLPPSADSKNIITMPKFDLKVDRQFSHFVKPLLSFLFLLTFLFGLHSPVFAAPTYQWTKTVGGTGNSDIGYKTVFDSDGNLYIIGYFLVTVDFDPGAEVDNKTSNGGQDIYLTKYNADDSYGWTKTIGGSGNDNSYNLSIDSSKNVYLTGFFSSTVDFDPGAGVDNKTSNGGEDIYLTKYNADGSYQWTKTFGGSGNEISFSLSLDSSNNIYLTGYFNATVDFDPEAGTDNKTSNGGRDSFLTKFSSNGSYQWTKTFGGSADDQSICLSLDSNTNIYLTGYFNSTVDFDPGAGVDNKTSNGSYDIFLSKYNADGSYAWTKTFGGSGNDIGYSISLDTNNNLYVTGTFSTTVDFDPGVGVDTKTSNGGADIYISKYNSDGSYAWTKTFGGSGTEGGWGSSQNVLTVNNNDVIYIGWRFQTTVDFDAGDGIDNKTSMGSDDIFITSYDANGTYRWTKAYGSVGSNLEGAVGVTTTNNDYLYVTGYYKGTIDFDFSDSTDNHTSAGGGDIFLLKIFDDTTAPAISLTALTPDPNSDNTPTLTGTATDVNGTVSSVEYQMDSTSGSWTACSADDGAFDESSEAFTCTSTALTAGSHTMYIRATDSNGNTTLSGNESSDSFEIFEASTPSLDLTPSGVSEPNDSGTAVLGAKTVTSADEVEVSWDRPADTSNIDHYTVYYREIGESDWETEEVDNDADSITFDPGEGKYEWYLEITYTDGSTSQTNIYKFEIDQTDPIIPKETISLQDEIPGTTIYLPYGSPLVVNTEDPDGDKIIEIWDWDRLVHYDTMVCGSGVCDHGHLITGNLTLVIYMEDEVGNESEEREIKVSPFNASYSSILSEPTASAPSVQAATTQLPANSSQLAPGIVRGAVEIDTSINPTAINNPGIVSGAVDFSEPKLAPEPPRQNILQRIWSAVIH